MNSIKVEIITPSKLFYRGDVDLVIVTTLDGDEGFMAGHCWGCKLLDIGELWIQEAGEGKEWRVAAISGGFIEIKDSIIIYTDAAEWAEEIDMERSLREKERAELWLAENEAQADPDDILKAKIAITKALTQQNVAGGSMRHH